MRILIFLLTFLLLSTLCFAQPSAEAAIDAATKQRIEQQIRNRYSVPPSVSVAISAPGKSDVPGYDNLTITFAAGQNSTSHVFLISKDRKTLAHLETIDISEDVMSKISLTGRPVRGNKDAKVTMVIYTDLECPFCAEMHSLLLSMVLKNYGDRVKVVYKDYPLTEAHPWAMHAAVDANCLLQQSEPAYWDFADYVLQNQRGVNGGSLTQAFSSLDNKATAVGEKFHLDAAVLSGCIKKSDETAVRASMEEGDRLGVDSTPSIFINGLLINGVPSESDLRSILDRMLK